MRKEQGILENVADAPALRRDIDPCSESNSTVSLMRMSPASACAMPAMALTTRRLAGAGAAEEAEDRRIRDESDREAKISERSSMSTSIIALLP